MFRLIKNFLIKIGLIKVKEIQKSLEDIVDNVSDLAVEASTIGKKISDLKKGMNFTNEEIQLDKKKLQKNIQEVINTLQQLNIDIGYF